MRRPRTVLHVAPFLWSGAGGVITRLCESQCQRWRVVLVTTSKADGLRDWAAYRRRLAAAGVEHHAVDVFHRDAARFWDAVSSLAAIVRSVRPSVIHAHAGVPTGAALLARQQAGISVPVIGQMYSWGPNRPAWMDRMDLWAFGAADRVICSARAYERILAAGGVSSGRMTYLPWGLPLEELPFRGEGAPPRRHPVSANRGPAIGFVGRLEPRKGQLAVVEAMRAVRRRTPAATLELVGPEGDVTYAADLRARIDDLGLASAVTLRGNVRHVPSVVANWDLFVSASSDEGQGMAVLEACALGVPVLARIVPGLEDFLRPGTNCLAIEGVSSRAIARGIADALDDPRRLVRLRRAARRLVERRYAWSSTVEAFERLYAAL